MISFFKVGDAATKCRADLTEIISKFIMDIWMISKSRRLNLRLWIHPFLLIRGGYFRANGLTPELKMR